MPSSLARTKVRPYTAKKKSVSNAFPVQIRQSRRELASRDRIREVLQTQFKVRLRPLRPQLRVRQHLARLLYHLVGHELRHRDRFESERIDVTRIHRVRVHENRLPIIDRFEKR